MLTPTVQYRIRKLLPKVLLSILMVLVLPLMVYVLFFHINRFSLVVEPRGGEIIQAWGEEFADPGADVKLVGTLFFREGIHVDAALTTGGDLDTGRPGSYHVEYGSSYFSWQGSARRSVLVVDNVPPEITLHAVPGSFTIPGEPYQEEGFSARDDYDGDLTARVETWEEDGFVHYRVSDSSGNTACVSRKIRYFDPIPPEITLLGDLTIQLDAGTAYEEPGWTAADNVDGDLTHRVQVSGEVDRYLSGTYELTYTVADDTGNTHSMKRTVIVVPRPQPDTVDPTGKVIYLTFDDGPSESTQQLLEVLEKYNVKATFFVINSDYAHLIGDIVEQGHAIGIHSVTHDYSEIYASPDAFFRDLLAMQEIIYEKSGVKTYLMRFPGGSSNTVSRFNPGIMTYLTQAVEDMGFCYFDWNVDSNDAGGARSAQEVFGNVTSGAEDRRISVVLQHDTKAFSVEAVERIIAWGLENGYTFLPLEMSSPTAHHGVNN